MYLEKLEIQGFKSFATKTTLEFKREMTAIVGPNGSGKSNIADAVRWVLGEQSLKLVRGKRAQDVIFSGSDRKSQLGMAEVSLYLNNEDHKAPIDYSELVITRRVNRDGSGEYFINKSQVRLHDILLLLAKANFGQRTYSVIGQGMIDSVLIASPGERLQFFEEAAGIRQYQIKKEQAENKLVTTRENLKQADMLLQEITPRLRSLTRQAKRLEQREEHEKKLGEYQREYYSGMWADLTTRHGDVEKHMREVEAKKNIADQKVVSLNKSIEVYVSKEGRGEAFAKYEQQYQSLADEKNRILRELTVVKGRADVTREQKGEMNLVWLERKRDALANEIRNAQAGVGNAERLVKEVTERLTTKQQEEEHSARSISELEIDLAEVKRGLSTDPSISALNLHGELKNIVADQEDFLKQLKEVKQIEELPKLQKITESIVSQLAHTVEKSRKLSAKDPNALIQVQEKIADAFKSQDQILHDITDLTVEVRVAEEKYHSSQEQLKKIQEEHASIERDVTQLQGKDPEKIAQDQHNLEEQVRKIDSEIGLVQSKLDSVGKDQSEQQRQLVETQRELRERQKELTEVTTQLHEIQIEHAKLETRKEDLDREMMDELSDEDRERVYQSKHPSPVNEGLMREIQKEKRYLELIGGIDEDVPEEYGKTKERHDFLSTQIDDLTKASTDLEEAIDNLNQIIKKQFDLAFEKINLEFGKYFKTLFKGGNAKLNLVKEEVLSPEDQEDEDAEEKEDEDLEPKKTKKTGEKVLTGVDIFATPPGKRLKSINMLSGGERALTAIALISAIISNNPSPFVVLDEVDAALDESNSLRFAEIIDQLSNKTQFVTITHNRATMHKARILYGVTMGDDGVSKLLSVEMDEAEKVLGRHSK
ncbi:chromosome segregation SMC family protein [Patescibacteria group bacterium]